MEYLTRGEELEKRVSENVTELLVQFKKGIYDLFVLREKIKVRCWDEGLTDEEVWILLNHACETLEIEHQTKKKILAPFRPQKIPMQIPENITPQKRVSSMETYEGNMEIWCPLTALDKNKIVAKQKMMGAVRVIQEGFTIKLHGYDFVNLKPDGTEQWIVPEEQADETYVS